MSLKLDDLPKALNIDQEFNSLVAENDYVETEMITKFGDFFIRVYKALDSNSKETFVLWKGSFSDANPPLVRVHSECITGDLMGSLKCDCGKQLHKSLKLIQKEGGILIYLRQEGRGIGLFEKIKAYELQEKGYDTFEANTILGHRPDARTYEMVKTVLDDFNLHRIRILTNNPSKVSEIAKYGVEIIEQVPLYIPSNKYNRKYYETKRKKFHHNFDKKGYKYFYQFHTDSEKNLKKILKKIDVEIKDPFFEICVGVSTTTSLVHLKQERSRIEKIYKVANSSEFIKPVLHLSFRNCSNSLKELDFIKKFLPFVSRIQTNDLRELSYSFLKKAYQHFEIDLPLSDDNFDIILNPQIKKLVKKYQGFILLDNSKGKGKAESFDSYRKKIDLLFENDLKNIGLCGGFGPKKLGTFFALRNYYRVNFSIDAESSLKKNGKVDIELTNQYLNELLVLTTPITSGVLQTKSFIRKQKRTKWESIDVEGRKFLIHPQVFHAGNFPSSRWYAQKVSTLVRGEKDFCEIGCGSGIISCLVALKNPKIRVSASDINAFACINTRINSEAFGVAKRTQTFTGDVFEPLRKTARFDTVFWAMPFGFLEPGIKLTLEELQVFDSGYQSIYKFFSTAKSHLHPNGRLLIGFSNDLGNRKLLDSYAKQFCLHLKEIDSVMLHEDKEVEFILLEGRYF
ncbi:MAG: GTP cyclohydrolase II [Halobacteriovoraceae bacterium]|nr:GTP cyclohydrolase II [Halobacteriovoraceae bacterium]